MAGIGFVLRKLLKKNNLTSLGAAFFHSMMASSGPWIITIMALGSFFLLSKSLSANEAYIEFRLIIMFNFSLSLVLAAPITNCSTRYLADLIYTKHLNKAPGLMIGMLFVIFAIALPFSSIYYGYFTNMRLSEKYQAVLNFMLISSIWHASIFISALKYYKVITMSFLVGMMLSVLGAIKLAAGYSMIGMLVGFNIGLGFIFASLLALIFIEYPPVVENLFKFIGYFKRYWEIALGFLFYGAGLWVDKWIMWFAPESVRLATGMRMYPDYDSSMFVSYLTVIPVVAIFLLSQETIFYEAYYQYYHGIQEHDSFEKIRFHFKKILSTLAYLARNLLFIQAFICLGCIVLSPLIFNALGINLIEIGIFRIGVLGASFQVLSLFLMVILSYFDARKEVLISQVIFFVSNALFTYWSLHFGFAYYGYGFFGASLLTFIVAAVFLERYLRDLPYHTFVTQNLESFLKKEGS